MEYGNLNTQVLYKNVFEQKSSFCASYKFSPTYTRHKSQLLKGHIWHTYITLEFNAI